MTHRTPAYQDLYFGASDSRNEAIENPDEFVRSYVDIRNATRQVLSGAKFLVLGPKGAGKSALAWFLDLTEGNDHLTLVRDASQLPLAEVPRLQTGQQEGPERTVVAWRFILLCNYLELLLRDQSSAIQNNREAIRVSKLLRDFGFVGDASGRALLRASSTTVSIPIPKLGEIYKKESRATLNIYNLTPYLESWVSECSTQVRHTLILDGLDSIFLNDRKYDESLSSLVQAAYLLNQRLRTSGASGTVTLLLRNDVFSRIALSLPDSQKMRDDLSVELDWRILSGEAGTSAPLMKLVNRKAAHALGRDTIQVLNYFPNSIQVGGRKGGRTRSIPTLQYLLNLTRHTPRDLLRLFEEIRKVEETGVFPTRGTTLSRDVIREGVLQYCTHYFVGAIKNEFAGFEGGPEAATASLSALQANGKQLLDSEEFRRALNEVAPETASQHRRLLELLFYAGAIGNYVYRPGGDSYMKFYHRRDDAEIYLKGRFILHNALVHAWNIPFSA